MATMTHHEDAHRYNVFLPTPSRSSTRISVYLISVRVAMSFSEGHWRERERQNNQREIINVNLYLFFSAKTKRQLYSLSLIFLFSSMNHLFLPDYHNHTNARVCISPTRSFPDLVSLFRPSPSFSGVVELPTRRGGIGRGISRWHRISLSLSDVFSRPRPAG